MDLALQAVVTPLVAIHVATHVHQLAVQAVATVAVAQIVQPVAVAAMTATSVIMVKTWFAQRNQGSNQYLVMEFTAENRPPIRS